MQLSVKGKLSLGRVVSLYGCAGANWYDLEYTGNDHFSDYFLEDRNESGIKPALAAGVEFRTDFDVNFGYEFQWLSMGVAGAKHHSFLLVMGFKGESERGWIYWSLHLLSLSSSRPREIVINMRNLEDYLLSELLKLPSLKKSNLLDVFSKGVDPLLLRSLVQNFWTHEETDPNEDVSFVFMLRHWFQQTENPVAYKIYLSCILPVVTIRFFVQVAGGGEYELSDVDPLENIESFIGLARLLENLTNFGYTLVNGDVLDKKIDPALALRWGCDKKLTYYNFLFSEY